MRSFLLTLLCGTLMVATGCSRSTPSLTLATTTSTQDSGLLDVLLPLFRRQTGFDVKVVAVGTGQALELGRRGDADVLLVHDPVSEQRFMDEGHASLRRAVMHNDFVLVGPPADAAAVRGLTAIVEAFGRIARSGEPFVSRGDESGTHQKEKEIWRRTQTDPQGAWYVRAGAGMGQVLHIADQKRAYTLTDRATFLARRDGLNLVVLSEGDPVLVNPYHVIVVSPEGHPGVHYQAAQRFVDFLLAPDTRKIIGEFGTDRYGQPLFVPDEPETGRQ